MNKILGIVVISLLLSVNSYSKEYGIAGMITQKCSRILEFKEKLKERLDQEILTVANAYWSGMNSTNLKFGEKLRNLAYDDTNYKIAYILNYCKKNPDKTLGYALDIYYLDLPFCKDGC